MVEQIKKERATYRIVIYDLEQRVSKTMSFVSKPEEINFEVLCNRIKEILN